MIAFQGIILILGLLYVNGGEKVTCDITVRQGKGAAALKTAVENAGDGARVCVESGVYDFLGMDSPFLRIKDKSIHLVGLGGPAELKDFYGFLIESTRERKLRLEHMTLKPAGRAIDASAAIVHIELDGVIIRGGTSERGGGVLIGHGDLDARNSVFIYNTVSGTRGAAYGAAVLGHDITREVFMENLGRKIRLKDYKNAGFHFKNCIFQNNGGIGGTLTLDGDVDIEDSLFVSNSINPDKGGHGSVLLGSGRKKHTIKIRNIVVVDQCGPDPLDLGNKHLKFEIDNIILPACAKTNKAYARRGGVVFKELNLTVVPGTDFKASGLPKGTGPDLARLLDAVGIKK